MPEATGSFYDVGAENGVIEVLLHSGRMGSHPGKIKSSMYLLLRPTWD